MGALIAARGIQISRVIASGHAEQRLLQCLRVAGAEFTSVTTGTMHLFTSQREFATDAFIHRRQGPL